MQNAFVSRFNAEPKRELVGIPKKEEEKIIKLKQVNIRKVK